MSKNLEIILKKLQGLAKYSNVPKELAICTCLIDSYEAKLLMDYIKNQEKWEEQYELLLKRFQHLIQSKIISEYDALDYKTGNYKLDITKFDKLYKKGLKINDILKYYRTIEYMNIVIRKDDYFVCMCTNLTIPKEYLDREISDFFYSDYEQGRGIFWF